MRVSVDSGARLFGAVLGAWAALWARPAAAQELGKVAGTRPVVVAGIVSDPHNEDLLGLARVQFQGVIASELAAVGYHVVDVGAAPGKRELSTVPLTLVGIVKEEICDDQKPRQCRIALLWELRNQKGVVVYRALTRAVDQAPSVEKERRSVISGALRSLLQRPRFALQLTDAADAPRKVSEPLGFKQCARPALHLPEAARSVAASYVLVESGSHVAGGAILSPDGFILTAASGLDEAAPLQVRLSAQQKLPAEIVAVDGAADVALIQVGGHFDTTCLALRESPLETGEAVFGVSSPLSEERATSLTGSVVQGLVRRAGHTLVRTDSRIAQAEGAPLIDSSGRLAALVSAQLLSAAHAGAQAIDVQSALVALNIKPAAITDPRLAARYGAAPATDVSYVRDTDDPPYALTQRYTYGTSHDAHTLRNIGMGVAAAGAVGVVVTWSAFRSSQDLSEHSYNRLVVFNGIAWALVGIGAAGIGVSFLLPEAHDVVGVQSAQRKPLRLSLGPGSMLLSGAL
ncbi:MAG TPA: serine protease [Polyangiaceae bacterium]|nr:serine protease [Polyangiaceae bacterium]